MIPVVLIDATNIRRVYTAVYLSKGNTFQKLTGKNGHVDTLVGYNFQKENLYLQVLNHKKSYG